MLRAPLADKYRDKIYNKVKHLPIYYNIKSAKKSTVERGAIVSIESTSGTAVVGVSSSKDDLLAIYLKSYFYRPPKGYPGLFTNPKESLPVKDPNSLRKAIEFIYDTIKPIDSKGKIVKYKGKKFIQ